MPLTSFEDASARQNKKVHSPAYDILAMEHPGTTYLGNFVADFGRRPKMSLELFTFAKTSQYEDVTIQNVITDYATISWVFLTSLVAG